MEVINKSIKRGSPPLFSCMRINKPYIRQLVNVGARKN